MKSRQVPFFLYWPVENVQFCINSIGHLGWLSGISNFPRFHKNVSSLELWKYISEDSSPKGSFWRNKRKSEFSDPSSDSPYLQAMALKYRSSIQNASQTYISKTRKIPSQISIKKKWTSTFRETLALNWATWMINRTDDETVGAEHIRFLR